jgi:parallel beta-helix repeat protein
MNLDSVLKLNLINLNGYKGIYMKNSGKEL